MTRETGEILNELCSSKYDNVILVDVFNQVFKNYFANRDLSAMVNGREVPTGHLYGVTRSILFLREHFPTSAIILAIDGHDDARREVNPEYKAGRVHEIEPMHSMKMLTDFCSLASDVYACYDPNFEADDAVCSITTRIRDCCNEHQLRKRILIMSNDKDMWQLITTEGYCKVLAVRKWGFGPTWWEDSDIVDEAKVTETFNGVSPSNLLKFRAITGDASDNLKGYYRYFKKNAAIIAENYDYDRQSQKLVLKEGHSVDPAWADRYFRIVGDNMGTFTRNYEVMSMKSFDFELHSLPQELGGKGEIGVLQVLEELREYQMSYYLENIGKYSPFREIIDGFNRNNPDSTDANDVLSGDGVLDNLLGV